MISYRLAGSNVEFCLSCGVPTLHRTYRVGRPRFRWFGRLVGPVAYQAHCCECALYATIATDVPTPKRQRSNR